MNVFPQKYANFYGMTFNLSWLPLTPYWMEEVQSRPDGSKVSSYSGKMYLIMQVIADVLNFTINPLPFEGWDSVLARVKTREAFLWPTNMPIMPHLLQDYDYSLFLELSTLAFSMAKPTLKPNWQSLYYPLQLEVWGSIAASICFVFVVLILVRHSRLCVFFVT
ncbi:uncharacterized protein LOC135108267 [Scylla paramamosain]|uniref:uncharacterized protein LOC135108267 n=1 Tax=Scylla paramamosain TaxID=85552 RepID=UPI0030834471